MKVVVIGAGASGIIASLKISEKHEVILLEQNDKNGKKILLTGNGHCNYWNSNINTSKYNTDSIENLTNILECKEEVYTYLTQLGIYPKIKNGYYYPNSNQASTIQELLCKKMEKNNVNIQNNCKVEKILKQENKFLIKSNLEDIICDKVIIATGASSAPKTGTTGESFEILRPYHTINKVLPALVPLKLKASFLKDWNNLRVDANLKLFVNDECVKEEYGEIQLTDYGISGIPTLNISSLVSRALYLNKKVKVSINFLKDVDVLELLNKRNNILNGTIETLLETILPYQLIFLLLKESNINRNDYWDNIKEKNKQLLINNITNLTLDIIGTLDFDRSQVSTGGVSLKEVNSKTMESLKVPGLYLTGELLDVDGICGGFNLAFAFITGYLAGSDLSD